MRNTASALTTNMQPPVQFRHGACEANEGFERLGCLFYEQVLAAERIDPAVAVVAG